MAPDMSLLQAVELALKAVYQWASVRGLEDAPMFWLTAVVCAWLTCRTASLIGEALGAGLYWALKRAIAGLAAPSVPTAAATTV